MTSPIPKLYAVIYSVGPNWVEDVSDEAQGLKGHIDYQHSLHDDGILIMGGPFKGGTPRGMALMQCGTLDQLKVLVSADPMVEAGKYNAEVLEWKVVLSEFKELIS